jgi:hypothetical protein
MTANNEQLKKQADALYEQYAKPLEEAHQGAYVAVSPDGKTVLGATLLEVSKQAKQAFGPGSFVFKVGEKAVGKWR